MDNRKSIVFLYSELAGYFIGCLTALREEYSGEIIVIHWPVNPEAPFEFDFPEGIQFVEKHSVPDLTDFVKSTNPETIVSAGWMDKEYLEVCKSNKGIAKTVLAMDNHWTGSLKQRIACLLSPFMLKNKFSHVWVPGNPQRIFAEKLGFTKIILDYYCGDVQLYQSYYERFREYKEAEFPRKFLYVGRYVEHKGIFEMWDAFINAIEDRTDWELWCLGTGNEYSNRIEHEQIKHFGFVQPDQMAEYIKGTSFFVLPSKFEPWGVVVQEYAAAGFPMLLSENVGASERFLKEKKNGLVFKSGDVANKTKAFKTMMSISSEQYVNMAGESASIGSSHTTKKWAKTILEIN